MSKEQDTIENTKIPLKIVVTAIIFIVANVAGFVTMWNHMENRISENQAKIAKLIIDVEANKAKFDNANINTLTYQIGEFKESLTDLKASTDEIKSIVYRMPH
jgi:hypothetical protein